MAWILYYKPSKNYHHSVDGFKRSYLQMNPMSYNTIKVVPEGNAVVQNHAPTTSATSI